MITFEIDDLNEEQKELVEVIGLEAFNALVYHYGGSSIYIPKTDTIERQARNVKICEAYKKGEGIKSLSNKYHLTENQIRSIISDIFTRRNSDDIVPGQISMFDKM